MTVIFEYSLNMDGVLVGYDMDLDEDLALALQLQQQFENELNSNESLGTTAYSKKIVNTKNKENEYKIKSPDKASPVDPSWEYIDPTPDIHALFMQFDKRFFWGKLKGVEVKWSPRMTSSAGVCCYEGRGGLCSIRLSLPLLKLRPRKDLVETLLHEMIHAYLFVTHNNRDRDGHGSQFHKHMDRINEEAGTNITVYHSFHDEVRLYRQHWWRCDGPCKSRPPFFGTVKRATNRAPGPSDLWWKEHQETCGGNYIKVHEPEKKPKGSKKSIGTSSSTSSASNNDIRNFFPFHGKGNTLGNSSNTSNIQIPIPLSVPKFTLNNVVSLKDLVQKRENNGGFHNEERKGSSDTKSKINGIHNGGNKSSDSFPKINVNKPVAGNKIQTDLASGRNSNMKSGGFGGMLANKGGGTLVIAAKRNKKSDQSAANIHTFNGRLGGNTELSDNFVPFNCKGHTLGSESKDTKTNGLLSIIKHEPSALGSIKSSSKLLDKDFSSDSSKTSLSGTKASKRHSSVVGADDASKKIKTDSLVDTNPNGCSVSKEMFVKCPVCNSEVKDIDINSHLDSCIGPAVIVIDGPSTSTDTGDEPCILGSVKCPACNKEMLKGDMEIHLEKCLESVFGGASVTNDNWGEEKGYVDMKTGDTLYPCPCCPAMVKEVDMNSHLDQCLPAA